MLPSQGAEMSGPQGCAGRRVISEQLLCVCVTDIQPDYYSNFLNVYLHSLLWHGLSSGSVLIDVDGQSDSIIVKSAHTAAATVFAVSVSKYTRWVFFSPAA